MYLSDFWNKLLVRHKRYRMIRLLGQGRTFLSRHPQSNQWRRVMMK